MNIQDSGCCSAVESLRSACSDADADVAVIADSLNRKEISLLTLKRAGLSAEIIEACFLLSLCTDSLMPERIEGLRVNPLAKSRKIMELRTLLENLDRTEAPGGLEDLFREPLVQALNLLENGPGPYLPWEKSGREVWNPAETREDPYWESEG